MSAKNPTSRGTTLVADAVGSRPWIFGACIIILTSLAYSNSFTVPLLFDDIPAIANNTTIRQWSTALQPPVDSTAGGRPVLNLSLAVNYAVSGTEVRSYHLVNLMIHLVAGLVLFGIIRRTPVLGAMGGTWIPFCGALLWCLHPLQTASVTYIVQRAESLMGLLYLLTLYCFLRGVTAADSWRRLWFALSIVACALGMGTKEVMVSAPVIVLLFDRTFVSGSFRGALRVRGGAYAGLAATWILLLVLVLSTNGRGGSAGISAGVSFWDYLLAQFPAVTRYLLLSIWPDPLVFYYGTQWVSDPWSISPYVIALLVLVASLAWVTTRPGLPMKSISFAGLWFFAVLAPTSFVPIVRQTMAEHRMYLALVPVIVGCVFVIRWWLGRAAVPLFLVVSVVFAGLTVRRNQDYRSAIGIWSDTVAKLPDNAFARYNLGRELEHQPGQKEEAAFQYREAVRLKPDFVEARTNLSNVLLMQGKLAEAVGELEVSLRLAPKSPQAHNNLGYVLIKTPARLGEAIDLFQTAVLLKPDYAEAHCNLGAALVTAGRIEEAVMCYEKALRIRPEYMQAHFNLGNALAKTPGKLSEAVFHLKEAARLQPNIPGVHLNLAVALLNLPGRKAEAQAHLETVLRLQPENHPVRDLLARLVADQQK